MALPTQYWDRVRNLVDSVLEYPPDQRPGFLDRVCADSPELRESVENLLEPDDQSDEFMELPPFPREFVGDDEIAGYYEVGQRVGSYILSEYIASGGMGHVYKAFRGDDAKKKPVAVKLIRESANGSQALRRFYRERQTLSALHHPNIARLLDGGRTENRVPYLVMEYVDGLPINEYCRDNKLAIRQRLYLFCDICSAVAHAHQRLVVHRDLKPANILVTENGTPKLLDFGIAKLLDRESDMYRTLTGDQRKVMTLRYASPEQVSGQVITTSCDVYSLGVILYELLTGKSPYKAIPASTMALGRIICECDPEKPSTAAAKGELRLDKLVQTLRGDLDVIVLTALQKDPARRYDSVESFRDDIQRYIKNLPIFARKDTFFYRTGKLIRRHKPSFAALLLALFSLAFGIYALTAGLARARAEAELTARINSFLRETLAITNPLGKENATTVSNLLDDAAKRIEFEFAGEPEIRAELHATIGRSYRGLGCYEKAVDHLRKSADLQCNRSSPDTVKVTETLLELGETYSAMHDLPHAVEVTDEAMKILENSGGTDSVDYASALSARAILHQVSGQLDEAISLHRRALALRRLLLPEGDKLIVRTLLDLTTSLRLDGQLVEARACVNEASLHVEISNRSEPEEKINLLQRESSLARDESELDIARKTLEKELFVRNDYFGSDHPANVFCLMRLSTLCVQQGDLHIAGDYARKACDICRKTWSNPTPLYAGAFLRLAGSMWSIGDYQSAENAAFNAITVLSQLYEGEDNPDVNAAKSTLAVIVRDSGQYEQAENLLLAVLEFRQTWYGREHRYVADTLNNLASLYYLIGEFAQGESYVRQALELRLEMLPRDHLDIVSSELLLGSILTARGELEKAEDLLVHSMRRRTEVYPQDHWLVAESESALADCLIQQQRFEEAESLLQNSLAVFEATVQPQHKLNRLTLERLVRLYDSWNKPAKSAQYETRLVEDPR